MAFEFWSEDKTQRFRGQICIGPTTHTHCTCCNKKKPNRLEKGIAVTFTDENGTVRYVSGPSCFRKHTDLEEQEIPVAGWSFADVRAGRHTPRVKKKSGGRGKGRRPAIDPTQEDAYINVALRANILPAAGFNTNRKFGVKINQELWERLQRLSFPYSANDLAIIQAEVEREVTNFNKPSRDELECAYAVFCEISRLEKLEISAASRKFIESCKSHLLDWYGLTNAQMKALEKIAQKNGRKFSELDIRFPQNEARFQARLASKNSVSSLSVHFNRVRADTDRKQGFKFNPK